MEVSDRWKEAQKYERKHWVKVADRVASKIDDLKWYEWKARQFQKRIEKHVDLGDMVNRRILEIGSGPLGIVAFLDWGARFAVDPLEDFYIQNQALVDLRDGNVKYRQGVGEELPFEDDYFTVVIADNVLDHCQNPDRFLSSICRVLDQAGFLYITINVHTVRGAILRHILEKLQIDKGHPYTYTRGAIRHSLELHGFVVTDEEIEDYNRIRKQNLSSRSMKDKIKGVTGLSEMLYSAICRKVSASRRES